MYTKIINLPVAIWVTQISKLQTYAIISILFGQIWGESLAPAAFVLNSVGYNEFVYQIKLNIIQQFK